MRLRLDVILLIIATAAVCIYLLSVTSTAGPFVEGGIGVPAAEVEVTAEPTDEAAPTEEAEPTAEAEAATDEPTEEATEEATDEAGS
jgi:hypothetical protein